MKHATLMGALILAGLVTLAHAQSPIIRGCTNYTHGTNPKCVGAWFQEGPGGGDGWGSTQPFRQVQTCTSGIGPCTKTDNTGPVVGVYFDDTTPCPASLNGTPGTKYYSWAGGYLGQPCVQYWVNDEYTNNPTHQPIYAGLAVGIDGTLNTRFTHATTLLEWYTNSHPPTGQQGYILSLNTTAWDWCAHYCTGTTLADY